MPPLMSPVILHFTCPSSSKQVTLIYNCYQYRHHIIYANRLPPKPIMIKRPEKSLQPGAKSLSERERSRFHSGTSQGKQYNASFVTAAAANSLNVIRRNGIKSGLLFIYPKSCSAILWLGALPSSINLSTHRRLMEIYSTGSTFASTSCVVFPLQL